MLLILSGGKQDQRREKLLITINNDDIIRFAKGLNISGEIQTQCTCLQSAFSHQPTLLPTLLYCRSQAREYMLSGAF